MYIAALALCLSLFVGGSVAVATTPVEDNVVEGAAHVWTGVKAKVHGNAGSRIESETEGHADAKAEANADAHVKADTHVEHSDELTFYTASHGGSEADAHASSDLTVNADLNSSVNFNF